MRQHRELTRQEALWWVAPTLRYWRECLLAGTGSLGRNLPVLQFASNLGWYVRGAADLTPSSKVEGWLESSSNLFRFGVEGPWLELIGGVSRSAPSDLGNLEGNSDAERFWRFIGTAYDRFTAPEPEVASLWKDGETLLCGWDPLPPEDGRLPSKQSPEQLPLWWFDWVEQVDTDEWTWRVEAGERYDGVHADACWEIDTETEAGIQKETAKANARGTERVKATGEVFTPMGLVKYMVESYIPPENCAPGKESLDNSCGDGNFLVGLRKRLGALNGDLYAINHQIYGCDLMPDNVARARRRLGLVSTDQGWGHVVAANFLENGNPWHD